MKLSTRSKYARNIMLLGLSGLAGCGNILGVCTLELRPNLVVEVRDAVSGEPAAIDASGYAEHPASGVFTELFSNGDSLILRGNWSQERPGRYTLTIRKPGYITERASVTVDDGGCHVVTENVELQLSPDPAAVPAVPLSFELGPHVAGDPASVAVQALGDTLLIVGRAAAPCSDLELVALRSGPSWHIQLQPKQWVGHCTSPLRLQQFEARFIVVGSNQVLITHGYGPPVELFSGGVTAE